MALTEQQIAARQGRFTSTRIRDLALGKRIKVFTEMKGYAPPFAGNDRTWAGERLERAIVAMAAEKRGWQSVIYQPGTIIDPADPLFAASPDALADEEIVVEAKNRGGERTWEYDGGEPLTEEIVQVHAHMAVTGRHQGVVAVLLGGNDLRTFPVPFDADLWGGLVELCRQFKRDFLDTDKPPPFDDPQAADAYLKGRFPRDGGAMLEADATLTDLAHRYRNVRREREALEKSEALLAAELKAAIGNASGVIGPDFKISWKATKPTQRTDWEALVRELPEVPADLIVKHTKQTNGSRRFLPQFKGETP